MTDGLSTIVDSSSRNFPVIWRGLAPLTPAHRLMTLNPPPEIVTYHLDKLCAPTVSTEYCSLVVSSWLAGLACSVVQNCQTRPASDRLQCHRSIRTSTLPLDNKHHPILSLVTAPALILPCLCLSCPVLFWLAVHCFSSHSRHLLGAPSALLTRSHQSSFFEAQIAAW